MKTYKYVLSILICLLGHGTIYAQNLLNNWGFEQWTNATTPMIWSASSAVTGQENTIVYEGTYSLKQTVPSGHSANPGISQLISVTPGQLYELEFWYYIAPSSTGNGVRIWSAWKDAGNIILDDDKAILQPSTYLNSKGEWKNITLQLTAPPTASSFSFEVRTYKGATVYWDNFYFGLPRTPDFDAPVVTFNPADGSTGVDVSINPTITFDEPVRNLDDSEITDANVGGLILFKKNNISGVDVGFTATISADKKTITIHPLVNLNAASTYYIALYPVEDEVDNAVTLQTITFTTAAALNNEKEITAYGIAGQVESSTIDPLMHTVSLTMPYGTDKTALVATFTLSAGAEAEVSGVPQVSGTTANDFTSPVVYTVTAEDATAQNWTVTVTNQPASSEKDFLTFSIPGQLGSTTINSSAYTIELTMPFSSNVTALVPKFTLSDFASAEVGLTPQVSEVTANDFTNPVTYTATAQNGSTQNWTVTVNVDDLTTTANLPVEYKGPWKGISENGWKENLLGSDYSISPDKAAKFEGKNAGDYLWLVLHIDSDPDKVSYEVKGNNAGSPSGFENINFVIEESTNGSAWSTVRTITESDVNISGYTPFEDQLSSTTRYIRWAYKSTTKGNIALANVKVTKPYIASTETDILSYSISGEATAAVINSTAKTIAVTVPNSIDLTNLVATFTLSTGATAEVGGVPQVSGTTANDFTSSVVYTVTAEDGTTTESWTVTATVQPAPIAIFVPIDGSTNVALTIAPTITFDKSVRNIDDSEITDANVASLLTFKQDNATGVDIPFTATISADKKTITVTPNAALSYNTTYYLAINPVEDIFNNTTTLQAITFTTEASLSNEADILTYSIAGEVTVAVINSAAKTVAVTMPNGTNVTNLVATFTLSTGATAEVGGVSQVSGTTPNDFTSPVTYTIAAEDATIQSWTVTVTVQSGGSVLSELIISEYIEGTSNNKAIELYNGTGASIDLSAYSLKKETNGAGGLAGGLTLSGMLSSGSTYLIVHNSAGTELKAKADQATTNAAINFNGNDAVGLFKNDVLIDVIGVVGGGATMWGENVTLIRKCEITSPNTTYTVAEWDVHPTDHFDDAGSHTTCSGGSDTDAPIAAFNPADGSTNVALTVTPTITFDEPIRNIDDSEITDANVANLLTFKQDNATGVDVPFTATISADKKTVTVTPSSTLTASTTYYLAIAPVEDASDNATTLLAISFTTEAVDNTPPAATFAPTNGAVDVAVNVTPTITFDEPIRNIDDSEITDANVASLLTFKQDNATGVDVPFTATISADKKTVTITPVQNLGYVTTYYLAIAPVEDISDNATSSQSITFTTDIERTLNDEAAIISFTISGQLESTIIDNANFIITVTMPSTSNITSLTPAIVVSEGATISPASGVAQNFTIPVVYTVTAENGTEQAWVVIVNQRTLFSEANIESAITAQQVGSTEINLATKEVKLKVKKGTNVGNTNVEIIVSEGAKVTPNPEEVFNYRVPAVYTVTSENGNVTKLWTVALIEDDAVEDGSLKFSFLPGTYTLQLQDDVRGISGVEIYTTNGRRVYMNHNFNSYLAEVDMTRFSGGIYVVRVFDGKRAKVESVKIVR